MILRIVLAVWLCAATLSGIDIARLEPQGYVSDFAGVVDAAAKQDLGQYCRRVEDATGVQMAFVTLTSLEGQPLEEFANDLFRRWGIGKKGKDEGLLLLLVVRDHRSRLEVGRGLEPIITDGTAGSLLREMRPALRQNQFGTALGTAAHSLGQRIAAAKGVSIPEQYAPRRRVREQPAEFPFGALLGLLFLLFLIGGGMGGRRRGRWGGGGGGFLPGLILGSVLNRPRHGGYGGGGFGGYDSGGGFGGFGGGDSGGGGASSNW
jgi:uncharacterized protein